MVAVILGEGMDAIALTPRMCPTALMMPLPSIYSMRPTFGSLLEEYPALVVVPFCDEGVYIDDIVSILPMAPRKKKAPRRPVSLPMLECAAFVNSPPRNADQCTSTPSSASASEAEPATPDSGFSSDDCCSSTASPSFLCTPSPTSSGAKFVDGRLRLERSKTLPSALRKSRHVTSSGRKSVRFADALGLDLEMLQYFVRDDDAVCYLEKLPSTPTTTSTPELRLMPANFIYRSESETLHLTRSSCLTVASLRATGTPGHVAGQVNVLNVAFDKKITVRFTSDAWKTQSELTAAFSHRIFGTDDVDAFSFLLVVPVSGARIEFCVSYAVADDTFWDNNAGANYVLEWAATGSPGVITPIPEEEESDKKHRSSRTASYLGSRLPPSARLRSLSPLTAHADSLTAGTGCAPADYRIPEYRNRSIDSLPSRGDHARVLPRKRWGVSPSPKTSSPFDMPAAFY